MKPVFVTGVGFWTPGFPTFDAWSEDRRDPSATRPPCAILDARIARYTSLVTRMAVEAACQAGRRAGVELQDVPTVFGSTYGEIQIAFVQMDMIEEEGLASPARFKNSVHNTASGHFSIGTRNGNFTTAIAAGEATFAMCLLEAWTWLETQGGSIIVSVADEVLPDHLPGSERYDPLGVALHLEAEASAGNPLCRLAGLRPGRSLRHEPRIPERLAANPSGAGLAFVDALINGDTGPVLVEPESDGWSVELQAVAVTKP